MSPRAKLAYTTPANQFPLGVTMSPDRRRELLDWALEQDAWIIEDEYDAEYRYAGRPQPSLQSIDSSGCVIYIGTFTKMLFNSIRLGFVVVPDRITDAFVAGSALDRHSPTLDQAILAEFITEGHFGHHVRRMRQTHARRMSTLSEAAGQLLGGRLEVVEAETGMRTVAWIKTGQSDNQVAEQARARGLELSALSEFTMSHSYPGALILGFAGCAPAELQRGVEVLTGVLERE